MSESVASDKLRPRLEDVSCNLCGSRSQELLFRGGDLRRRMPGEFQVVRCGECGLVYVNPRPTRDTIGMYYPADYALHELPPARAVESLYYRLFRSLPVPPGSLVLDVGCGGGRYLATLRERGYRVAGTEVDGELVERLRREHALDVVEGLLDDVEIGEARFDAVTLWWVLEHTHDPLATLRAARRALRPGGAIVVSLHNFDSLGRLCFGPHWHHLDLPGHLYHFTARTLTRALESAGFESVRVRYDLVAKDLAPSLGYKLGLARSLDHPLANALALPFDLAGWLARRSGLITATATRTLEAEGAASA